MDSSLNDLSRGYCGALMTSASLALSIDPGRAGTNTDSFYVNLPDGTSNVRLYKHDIRLNEQVGR
jgi:hypothetical protein